MVIFSGGESMSDELIKRIESVIQDAMDPSMSGDACRRALLDTLLDQIDIAGFAIVPKQPTAAMIEEGWHNGRPGSTGEIYRAMIAAAPKVQG